MKLRVRLDGRDRAREHAVLADRVEDTVELVVDGEEFDATVTRTEDGVVVEVDGHEHEVAVDGDVARIDGEEIGFRITEFLPGQGPGGEGVLVEAAGRVEPPMPGKIVDVFVEEGDVVEAGDVLATLEAMKMQSEIEAPKDGTVLEAAVEPGDAVEGHQMIFAIGDPEDAD